MTGRTLVFSLAFISAFVGMWSAYHCIGGWE